MVEIDDATIKKSFTELNYIINNMGESLKARIPKDVVEMISTQMDTNYIPDIDLSKRYTEQNYMTETKAFLSVLLSDYICDESIKKKWREFDKTFEDMMKDKQLPNNVYYNVDVFGNRSQTSESTSSDTEVQNQLVEVKKSTWITKFITKIKNCFGKK